jgi:hypothetical protein
MRALNFHVWDRLARPPVSEKTDCTRSSTMAIAYTRDCSAGRFNYYPHRARLVALLSAHR